MSSTPPKTDFEAIFGTRSASIYHGMVARVAEKVDSDGRVVRPSRGPVPFSLDEFRDWLMGQLGGCVYGAKQCAYCNVVLNIRSLTVDHEIPLAPPWNGSLETANLVLACDRCNSRKGKMSARGFRKLVEWGSRELDGRDFRDMLGRMANGGAYLKERIERQRPATKTTRLPDSTAGSPVILDL